MNWRLSFRGYRESIHLSEKAKLKRGYGGSSFVLIYITLWLGKKWLEERLPRPVDDLTQWNEDTL